MLMLFLLFYNDLVVGEQKKTLESVEDSSISTGRKFLIDLPKDGEIFEGDIIMDSRFRRLVQQEKSKKSALYYYGFLDIRWPRGIVYYDIDISFLPWSRYLLKQTMKQFEQHTCIRFRQRQYERNYVLFTSRKNECFSNVGMQGGMQITNLGIQCGKLGTFEHEIMHLLGMVHEHSRPDRNLYIKINKDNVERKNWNNFAKYRVYEIDNLGEVFNFASVMMYPNYAFSRNGRPTIEAIGEPSLKFGQREQFSRGDVRQINRLYRCVDKLDNPNYKGLVKDYHVLLGNDRKYKSIGSFERIMAWLQELLENIHFNFVF